MRRGERRLIEAATACKCAAGARYASRMRNRESVRWLYRYGERAWHCRITVRERGPDRRPIYRPADDVAEFGSEELQNFIASDPDKPANYVAAFDQFNDEPS